MKTSRFFRTALSAIISILFLSNVMFAGGIVKNKVTLTNSGTINATTFQNHNTTAGTLTNTGTVTVGTFDNDVAAATVNNNAAGTITTSTAYNNGAGSTNNSTATSTIKIGGSITTGALFDTQVGTVEYTGGAQTIDRDVVNNTYGKIIARNAGTKTIEGNLTAVTASIDNTTLAVSTFTLTVTGAAGIVDLASGVLDGGSGTGTVAYTGTGAQAIIGATYNNLTMTSTAPATKTAGGAITVNGTFTNDANTTFDVNTGNAFTTGASASLAANSGVIKVNGTVTFTTANQAIGGTFNYSGDGQAIGDADYTNITLSGSTASFAASEYKISGNFVTNHTPTLTAGNTIHYNGGSGQAVAALNYKLLKFSEAGTKTISGAVTATGTLQADVVVDLVTTNSPVVTVALGGSLSIATGTLQLASGATLNFNNGTVASNIIGTDGANKGLVLNTGTITVASSMGFLVNGDLTNDNIITNDGTITVQ